MLKDILIKILDFSELSQAEIARRIGVVPTQITNWKKGRSKIRFERLVQIGKVVGCGIGIKLYSPNHPFLNDNTTKLQTNHCETCKHSDKKNYYCEIINRLIYPKFGCIYHVS